MSNTVPEGWRESSIGEITSKDSLFCDGDWVESKDQDQAGPNRLIQLADVGDGVFVNKSSRFMNDEQFDRLKCTALKKNDILIARMPDPLGRACLYPLKAGRAATVVDVAVIRTPNADHYWLMSAINSSEFRYQIDLNASGTTRTRIARGTLSQIKVLEPPLPEQQKIAAILSSVDDVIEKTRAQIDKLKDLKTGMMQELLTKGIGSDGVPHTEFKDSPVGRIPVSWKIQSLKSLCRRITDGTHQAVKTSDSGEIPFLYVSCIRNGEILWDKASGLTECDYKVASKGRVASPGDVLYTAVGSYGHAALVETSKRFSFQRHIAFIQPNKSTIDPRYLVSVLNSTTGRAQADRFAIGNAQLTVTLGDLGTFMIPTPPIHEQNKIAKAITAITNNIREHETKLGSLLDLKKALMQDLLTGKVRVHIEKEALSHVE